MPVFPSPRTQTLDSDTLQTYHLERALMYGCVADLLSPAGDPLALKRTVDRLQKLRKKPSDHDARRALEEAALLLGPEAVAVERESLLAGRLGPVGLQCHQQGASAADHPAGAASLAEELRSLEGLARGCAESLEKGDLPRASELWDAQTVALRDGSLSCLERLARQLQATCSPFYGRVGRALKSLLESDAALAPQTHGLRGGAGGPFPEVSPEVVARHDVAGPRYTSYPTVPEWSEGFGSDELARHLTLAGATPERPLSLYVHLPFCEERCTYCGCNVVITKSSERADEYLDHLIAELDLVCGHLNERRKLAQIHWGGGTPTFLTLEQMRRLWEAITSRFEVLPNAEAAVEIDPRVTSSEQLRLLRELGFQRLSLGIQDFDPQVQEAVRRVQTAVETRALVRECRALGFTSLNFDLIYGLPQQNLGSWSATLEQVLSMRPDRIAIYSFAYLPDMRPHQKRLAIYPMPSGTGKLELFRHAYNVLVNAGYVAIGMDHFALPDDEMALAQQDGRLTRNFQGYTAAGELDVVAVGSSAISDVAGCYAQSVVALPKYYAAIEAGRLPTARGMSLDADDLRRRRIIRQLMCNFEVDLGLEARLFTSELEALRRPEMADLVRVDDTRVVLTPLGRIFVRNVAMEFDAYLKRAPAQHSFSRTV